MAAKRAVFLTMPLATEGDVILVRRRARQIALLVGFEHSNQTRVATAVSEAARFLYSQGVSGRIDFILQNEFAGLQVELGGKYKIPLEDGPALEGSEIYAARKLVNTLEVVSTKETLNIGLLKLLPNRVIPFSPLEIEKLSDQLSRLVHDSMLDELHGHNQELIVSLAELEQKQEQLDQAMKSMESQNEMLEKLNQEIRQLNSELEEKVQKRTSELETVNSQLIHARDQALLASQLKTQFVANVSHEIRTPLCGIVGLSEILTLGELDAETSKEMSETILSSSKQLINVVNQLLDFSKLQAERTQLNEQVFSLKEIISEASEGIAIELSNKQMELEVKIKAELGDSFTGDSEKLKQILTNFLHNAVKFSDTGKVCVNAGLFRKTAGKTYIKLEVIDSGIGIPEESIHKLFQPFVQVDGSHTRRYGGTGLGLSIAKGIAELMGGAIGCDSEEGKGSNFWVVIPFVPVHDMQSTLKMRAIT